MAKYVICSRSYDENNGGIIALHRLCHLLNEAGEDAYLWNPIEWHLSTWHSKNLGFKTRLIIEIKRLWNRFFFSPMSINPLFNTPEIRQENIPKDAIVIYPEVVEGNPLGLKNVVRWFLNKPGLLSGKVDYGKNELYFYFNPQFKLGSAQQTQLKILYVLDSIYFERDTKEREGTCYILRKGSAREIIHDLTDSVLVDGMSHHEISKIFNETIMCISYDTQTMLSKYAALCGCLSIVIPEDGIDKETWRPNLADRYGVAYGFDDLEWAESTSIKVKQSFLAQKSQTENDIQRFIKLTKDNFL